MPFKVIHLVDKLTTGGAQTVVSQIATARKDEIYVIRPTTKVQVPIDQKKTKITIIGSHYKYNILDIFAIYKAIANSSADIIHCHMERSNLSALMCSFFFPKIKFIIHEHGSILRYRWFSPPFWAHIFFNLKIYKFISVAPAVTKKLLEIPGLNSSRVVELPNPFDSRKYLPIMPKVSKDLRNKLNIPEDSTVFGFLGRLNKFKGITFLLEAFALQDIKSHLVLIGEGAMKNELRSQISRLSINNRVHMVGAKSGQDLANHIGMINIAVMPSLFESFGLVALEFLYYKIPLIASNASGFKTFLTDGKNALIVEKKNVAKLARKMKELSIDTVLQKELIKNGYQTPQNFSLPKYLTNLERLYNNQ